MDRRRFLAGACAALATRPDVAPALEGAIRGDSLFFKSPNKPLIDMSRNTGFFDPFEPDELPSNPEQVVPRAPRLLLSGNTTLAMWNANTDEHIAVQPVTGTGLDYTELARANHFMRDWRRNEVKPIDPQLVLGLLELQQKARRNGFSGEVRFLSGYRSRATNEMLRRKTNGVAKHSMHIQARAIDFSLPHVPIRETIRLAKELSLGGVGGYASFVHIDSGSRRAWGLS